MARVDRIGERIRREEKKHRRIPQLGYYLIVTDTEGTERCFFNGFKEYLPENVKGRLVLKVLETQTKDLIDECVEFMSYDPQYRMPWIVFDRDQVVEFDRIIKEANEKGINVGWSNPCFEIWMFSYWGSMPSIQESWVCCTKFGEKYKKKTGLSYDKADEKIYQRLIMSGDEKQAIKTAEQKYSQCIENGYDTPSKMCPCTTVHLLIQEIRDKSNRVED